MYYVEKYRISQFWTTITSIFNYRYEAEGKMKTKYTTKLDQLVNAMFEFLDNANISAVAMAQAGDYIGGVDSTANKRKYLRKCMNAWFHRTDRRFEFLGRFNDDTNTFVRWGQIGQLFLTHAGVTIAPMETQKERGGMTEQYLNNGTYVKSFYTVMLAPSCVRVEVLHTENPRIHHCIKQDHAYPKILSEKYKKNEKTGKIQLILI